MTARRLARIALAAVSLAGPAAIAGAQTVVNGSFQANVLADGQFLAGPAQTTGWLAAGGAGTLDPNTNAFAVAAIPDGDQVGFANAGGSLTQTFAEVLAANTTYMLTYYVGDRGDMSFSGYLVSLLGGGVTLASQGNLAPGNGQFLQGVLTYTTGATGPQIGQALGIRLGAFANPTGGQVAFDLVSLSTASASVGSITSPEPTTVALLAAGMLVIGGVSARRKRAPR